MKKNEFDPKMAEAISFFNIFSGMRDFIFNGLFNALMIKTTSKVFFNFVMIVYWIQLNFLLFTPNYAANWMPSKIYPYILSVYKYVHLPVGLIPLGYNSFLAFTIAISSLSMFGVFTLLFISRKSFRPVGKSLIILSYFKVWILLTQTVMVVPMAIIYIKQLSWDSSNSTLLNFPDVVYMEPKHFAGVFFTISGLVSFIPIFLLGAIYFHEPNSNNWSVSCKRPDYVHLINGFLITIAATGEILFDIGTLRYVIPLFCFLFSILYFFNLFLVTPYYTRSSGRVPAMGSLVFLWTSSISCVGAYLNNKIEGLPEIWLVGMPIVFLIGVFGKAFQLKPLYDQTEFLTEKRLVAQLTLLLQLMNEDKDDPTVSMVLDGFIELHIDRCSIPSCRITPIPLRLTKPELIEIKDSKFRNTRFLQLVELLFEEGVKKFEDSVSIRICYIALLVDRFKKRRAALNQIRILEEARPSGQNSFLLYIYKRRVEKFETIKTGQDNEEDLNEIAHEFMVKKFKDQMDSICCYFYEMWLTLTEETPNFNKVVAIYAKVELDIKALEEIWCQLSLYSLNAKFQYITLLSRFYSNILNDFAKSDSLMNEAKLLTKTISEKNSNFMNLRVSDSISDISNPIISISADSKTLGLITDTNNAAVAFFRFEKSELLNKNVRILLPKVIRGFHQGYLRKAFIDKKKSFNREKPLFALSKDGFLIQIYLTVKLLNGDTNLFVGRFRTASISKFTAMFLTDEDGVIDSFSAGCDVFFGFTNSQIINSENISNLIPNILTYKDMLLNRGVLLIPEEVGLSRPGFNIYIDISSYSHPNMDSSYYVYQLILERIKEDKQMISSRSLDNDFNFTLHGRKKKMVARRGFVPSTTNVNSGIDNDEIDDSDSQVKLHFNNIERYDYGIKHCRLENGELMLVLEEDGANLESKNDDDEIRKNKQQKQDELDFQDEDAFSLFFAAKKDEFRQKLSGRSVPNSLKLLSFFLFLLIFFYVIIFVLFIVLRVNNMLKMKDFMSTFKSMSDLGNTVQRGINIATLKYSENPGIIFNSDPKYFSEAFSQTVLSLEVSEMEIQSRLEMFKNTKISELFEREDIEISTSSGIVQYNFWNALRDILTQSFVLKQEQDGSGNTESKETRLKQIVLFYNSINGDFLTRINEIRSAILELTWSSIELTIRDLLFFVFFCSVLVLIFIVIVIYQAKNNKSKTELLILLIEINTNRVKHFCRKSELFRNTIISEENEDPQDLEYIVNEQRSIGLSNVQKDKLKKIRLDANFHPLILIKVIASFFILICVFIYSLLYYNLNVGISRTFLPELHNTLGIESDILMFQNKIFTQAFYPEIASNFDDFNTQNMNSIFDLTYRLMQDQVDTTFSHSAYYSNRAVLLFSDDLCNFWSEMPRTNSTMTQIFSPTYEDCQSIKSNPKTSGLLSSGIVYSLITYKEIFRDLIPLLNSSSEDYTLKINNCQASKTECVFGNTNVETFVKFYYYFLQEILAQYSEATVSDISEIFVDVVVGRLKLILALSLPYGFIITMIIILPYLVQKFDEMKIVRLILLIIPDLDLMKSRKLRRFVHKIIVRD